MHWISGLEGNHSPPTEAGKLSAQFSGGETEGLKIIMRGSLYALQLSPDIPRIRLVHCKISTRMGGAGRAENGFSFGLAVGLPDFLYIQHGQHHSLSVAQCNLAAAGLKFLGKF